MAAHHDFLIKHRKPCSQNNEQMLTKFLTPTFCTRLSAFPAAEEELLVPVTTTTSVSWSRDRDIPTSGIYAVLREPYGSCSAMAGADIGLSGNRCVCKRAWRNCPAPWWFPRSWVAHVRDVEVTVEGALLFVNSMLVVIFPWLTNPRCPPLVAVAWRHAGAGRHR